MAEIDMQTRCGPIIVRRPHTEADSPLRGWSAADELALNHLGSGDLGRVLIVNDEFGALTTALAFARPHVWTDSVLSRAAIEHNLALNGREALGERSIGGDATPVGCFDTVVIRVPKSSALLDHQLGALATCVEPASNVIGAGMTRHIHRSTIASFERHIGPTTTSRAVRKARLVFATPRPIMRPASSTRHEFTTADGVRVVELPGTFCAGHVDVGSALLLEVLAAEPPSTSPRAVGDLGCGNGVLAASLARRWPSASFVLTDVSDLAIAAARLTWSANALGAERADFLVADGFTGVPPASLDLVVTNPPFHQGHSLDAAMTDRLLGEVARTLAPHGAAFVVAQRHLNLHTRLLRWFGDVEVRSKHPTHVVLAGRNPKRSDRERGSIR